MSAPGGSAPEAFGRFDCPVLEGRGEYTTPTRSREQAGTQENGIHEVIGSIRISSTNSSNDSTMALKRGAFRVLFVS
jgi:hypothetical protein